MIRSMKFQAALGAILVVASMLIGAGLAQATVPAGFNDETVIEGLSNPTMVRFAPDGRVFVAEKGGKILVYENLQDNTPEVFANLSKPIYDFEDHGLLGIALDPDFETGQSLRLRDLHLQSQTCGQGDAGTSGEQPGERDPGLGIRWPGLRKRQMPGIRTGHERRRGRETSGRTTRVRGQRSSGADDRRRQWRRRPRRSVGRRTDPESPARRLVPAVDDPLDRQHRLRSGRQPLRERRRGLDVLETRLRRVRQPLQRPLRSSARRRTNRRSSTLGGSLRAQSVLRDHGLPGHETLLSGTVLRVNKATGEGVPGNPFASSIEKNARRIIGLGFRQPWRFAFNPRSSKLFVDNVGDGTYEEMDRLELDGAADYSDGEPAYNSGWPCYEGGPSGPHKNEHYTYASEPFPTLQYCIDMYEAEENGELGDQRPVLLLRTLRADRPR